MSFIRVLAVALLPCAALVACESHNTVAVGGSNGATVRLVNATSSKLDLLVNDQAVAGNGSLAFGASSSCTSVDLTNGTVGVRVTGFATNLPFVPALAVGGKYLLVAYPDAVGAIQLAVVPQTFTPTSTRTALAVFEGVPSTVTGNYDVHVTTPAAALATPTFRNLGFGFSTPFFDAAAGAWQVRLTDAGTVNVVIDAGSYTLAANTTYLLVIALPNPILATGC
jgi:hypothetical protein